jgi:phosphoenolpyruvate synthase/pyruvate phosphate dikinase
MQDLLTCGWKGSSLGEMTQAGFLVPNWFVLTTKAFWLDYNKRADEVFHAFDLLNSKFVAVRSSGTKEDGIDDSFDGQFDTYLFVTKENLIAQIMECHKSLDSERIKSYCEFKNIDRNQIKIAVVIQKMINSESAGVCFTTNPVTWNTDEIMIESWFGIGEAVVSWMITPDNYIVNKKTNQIIKNISTQEKKLIIDMQECWTKEVELEETEKHIQKLSNNHILELTELAKKIEKHYGKPMDIEWAMENENIYLLQARPVTTIF